MSKFKNSRIIKYREFTSDFTSGQYKSTCINKIMIVYVGGCDKYVLKHIVTIFFYNHIWSESQIIYESKDPTSVFQEYINAIGKGKIECDRTEE